MDPMSSIRRTADDASVSKLSAVMKGYYEDEFVRYFAAKQITKSPIINKGLCLYERNHVKIDFLPLLCVLGFFLFHVDFVCFLNLFCVVYHRVLRSCIYI